MNDRQATELQETGATRVFGQTLAEVIELVDALGITYDKVVLDNNDDVSIVVMR